ncbi:ATP-binding protein [Streptomyces cocklensis]|uniref:AAA domain-containing protein n=1 Tax=Actinacidiphila cocklensis TaxID=887465 RepID=A0A9W4DPV1_9ACTN|nr:ATP-binding protein [Actinacidiphila cocklensis]MDD1064238.1 ATP-binding protein [Actinacidiphila cocklensis]CAG6391823.1 AAA domain-containing protein [Actinacidiphila cocklensis]
MSQAPAAPTFDLAAYLKVPGARLVPTQAVLRTQKALNAAVQGHKVMCVYGDYGTGKTLSVGVTLHDLAPNTTVPVQPLGIGIKAFRHALATGLNVPADLTSDTARDAAILAVLAQHPHTLLCDEAQRLDNRSLDYLRALYDRRDLHLSIVMVGAHDFRRRMLARPAWKSRIKLWTKFTPLTPDEVLETVYKFHPVWDAASVEDIPVIDDAGCHGNFRAWAGLTDELKQALEENLELTYSLELVLWLLRKMNGFDDPA